jgi:prevent-host-death family protein
MARIVQASEAKTHLLKILDEVERGESVVITRHGRPIARLQPEAEGRAGQVAAAIGELRRQVRSRRSLTAKEIIAARDAGRRF